MFYTRTLTILFLTLLFQPAHALNFGRMNPSEVAVYAQDLHTGKILIDHQADEPMQPASTMKLITTFAALNELGSNYRWRTQFKSVAPITGNTLRGDIYWVGSGNPVFDQGDLIAMQQQLLKLGIHHIQGQLVLDRNVWGSSGSAYGFDDDASEVFATSPDPQMLAYKVVWVQPKQNEDGQITIQLDPPLPSIPQNSSVTVYPSIHDCSSLKNHLRASYQDGELHFSGRIPSSCIGKKLFINMLDMQDFATRSFINHWRALGGTIDSGYKIGSTPANARTLTENQSKPLSEVIEDMNKNSNNIIARSLFLTLGAEAAHNHQTVQNAKAAVREQLIKASLDDEALQLENGSGLSRSERATARMMGQMLTKAYHSHFKNAFINSLPISGVDGTLKHRFRNLNSQLRMKTGTLNNVRALAGYWLPNDSSQHPLAIVVFINSNHSGGYLPDMDSLVEKMLGEIQAQQMMQ